MQAISNKLKPRGLVFRNFVSSARIRNIVKLNEIPRNVINALHLVQRRLGYIDPDAILYISKTIKVPPSKIFGVASFYNAFRLRKPGSHICAICMGTACYVKGADKILRAIKQEFNVEPNGTSPDGKLTLLTVRCIGCCARAPNVIIDGEVIGNARPKEVIELLKAIIEDDDNESK